MTAPDFPALVAAARDRMDQAEIRANYATPGPWEVEARGYEVYETQSKHGDLVAEAGLTCSDAAHIAFWDPGMALRMVAWGRDVLDRHVPYATRTTECWADAEPWPCDDVLAVLRAWVPDLLDEDQG